MQHCSGGSCLEGSQPDSFTWLEQRNDARALEWVRAQNEQTIANLQADPRFSSYHEAALAVALDKNRLPDRDIEGWFYQNWIYEVWTDAAHPRGVLRRTRFESFCESNPIWQTLLDVDALACQEGKDYSFGAGQCYGSYCMLAFSEGGSTAALLWREFDVEHRVFVENGFIMRSQSIPILKDENTLLFAEDCSVGTGANFSKTTCVKEWLRGQPKSAAKEVFRAAEQSSVYNVTPCAFSDDRGEQRIFIQEVTVNGCSRYWQVLRNGHVTQMHLPSGCELWAFHRGHWVFKLSTDWSTMDTTWKKGSLVSIRDDEITKSPAKVHLLMEAGLRETIDRAASATGSLLVIAHENVRGRLFSFTFEAGRWIRQAVPLPDYGNIDFVLCNPTTIARFVKYESFLEPPVYYSVNAAPSVTPITRSEAQFDAARFVTEQFEAASSDGTLIPYFVVRPRALEYDGRAPAILYAYGGNGLSQYPRYDGILGRLWLDQGGVFVLANIRGGGEFGPAWHSAGIKTRRQKVYCDFIAVADDLFRLRITSPQHLGINGFSNGGGLMGVMLNCYPEKFGAIVIENGVLDMIRTDLQNGGSLVTNERGSPDIPEERVFLDRTSPYQNLHKGSGGPIPFLATSTTDEIVHPAMTRKFAAKMQAFLRPFFYYEAAEGGHGMFATPQQRAQWEALKFTYFARRLIGSP